MTTGTVAGIGGKHFASRTLGVHTVAMSAGAEGSDTIVVTLTLQDLGGNTVASAEAWELNIVGEPAGDYTCAETGNGTALNVTGHNACAFTFSAAGSAAVTVTDVSGTSNENVVCVVRPLGTNGVPSYLAITFDAS